MALNEVADANPAPEITTASPVGKPARPNYNQLHAKPFPLDVHPIPTFIPHNPFSVLHIAYVFISQIIFPPQSHPPVPHKAYFSAKTRSVNVVSPTSGRALWESGFFGKGTLSRSEPTWLERERRRRGLSTDETAEEITNRRREERREMKRERARKERELVEEQLKKEGKKDLGMNGFNGVLQTQRTALSERDEPQDAKPANGTILQKNTAEIYTRDSDLPSDGTFGSVVTLGTTHGPNTSVEQGADTIQDQESLQLSYEEAFFLTYGLGVLDICFDDTQHSISNVDLFQLFRQHSYFPARLPSALQLDDQFLLSYVVYHHFRSLGWVVRDGIKFAVDYLLYNRGPAFSHAEFAVVIVPAYEDPYWFETPARSAETKISKSWWWLHGINRVQAQVRKTLVLVYVEVPPPGCKDGVDVDIQDIGCVLQRYKVREFILKRWTPNRNRD
ncbi:MAG: hypothetical protein M1821_005722 [Bathelium mastoideum]|nr:MAG: hypothetical protein M1821_005722 [Bathelium mastoideum]